MSEEEGWLNLLAPLGVGSVVGGLVTKLIDITIGRSRMQAESEKLRAEAKLLLSQTPTPEQTLYSRTFEALNTLLDAQQKFAEEQKKRNQELYSEVEELRSKVKLMNDHINILSDALKTAGVSMPPLSSSEPHRRNL